MLMLDYVCFVCLLLIVSAKAANGAPAQNHKSPQTKDLDPLLLRAARGEAVERVPVWMMRQAGRHMKAYRQIDGSFRERTENPKIAAEISLQPWHAYRVDGVILFSDILTPLPAMGIDYQVVNEQGIVIEPTIRTRRDFERLQAHNFEPKESLKFVGEALQILRTSLQGSSATILGFVGLPWTILTYLVEGRTGTIDNFSETRKLMSSEPQLLRDLLDLLVKRLVQHALYQVESGAQIVQLFDSWAGWLPREEYVAWALPYQTKVVQALKQQIPNVPLIMYMAPMAYSQNGAYLNEIASTGVHVISIDHTIDAEKARKQLDDSGYSHVVLQGNLNPSTLSKGTKDEIVMKTRKIISSLKPKGTSSPSLAYQKHIMNLGHGIEQSTPEDHAELFVDTVQCSHEGEEKQ